MAVFLLILGLLALSGLRARTNGQGGVLGGPVSNNPDLNNSNPSFSLALLNGEATVASGKPDLIVQPDYFTDMGILGATITPDQDETEEALSPAGPDLIRSRDYFTKPAQGYNFGKVHGNNAVDIANSCGTIVLASAEGLVVPDKNYPDGETGWNGGYGSFVLVEHPSGAKTRYAHLEKTSVEVGDFVKQGQKIGVMGSTGNVHGVTGCHLHFEVLGAANPFVK
ncbi:MAG: Peptidase M23 [Parcubacteria group bacterium Gr01-1014_20]|nr:MAG: Peptidase M23 [Parcubacteria group bacterium Gr01-1014_20]